MTGLEVVRSGTLVDRALEALDRGPQAAAGLARDVLGLAAAPVAVADRLTVALLGSDPRVRRLPDGRWSLVVAARRSPLLEECAFAVVDVETTGSRGALRDRITEIAVVVVQGARCETVFDSLVNPERPIPSAVTAITRITNAMVRAAPTFSELGDRVIEVLAGRVFVAHNARFDWRFLLTELRRARDLLFEGPRVCTVRLARFLVRGLESYSLDGLSEYWGIENPARHRAGGDALTTARLLQRLLGLARDQGAATLADLEPMQARKTGRRKRRQRGGATVERSP